MHAILTKPAFVFPSSKTATTDQSDDDYNNCFVRNERRVYLWGEAENVSNTICKFALCGDCRSSKTESTTAGFKDEGRDTPPLKQSADMMSSIYMRSCHYGSILEEVDARIGSRPSRKGPPLTQNTDMMSCI
jgi:hypothetical protein